MFAEPLSQWLTGPAVAFVWLLVTTALMLLFSVGLADLAFL